MTKQSRIALAFSTTVLCLGVALAPTAFAASSTAGVKHHKAHKASAKKAVHAPAATAKKAQ